MHIRIHTADGFRLSLPIPNALLLNKAAAGWLVVLLARHLPSKTPLTPAQARQLVVALRRWRRAAPDRTLVDVQSADGDKVRITL